MVKRKICMLGAFSVGKTSLVSRFVHSLFSEKYHTTIGVKVDKKQVVVNGEDAALMIWDIYGEDDIQEVRMNYVRGAAGYLLVADGTRSDTLDVARQIRNRVVRDIGDIPFVLLINKSDLTEEWEFSDETLEALKAEGWLTVLTSAKTGEGVEKGFSLLADAIIE
ncbi:MAG: GTP-binding protein [Verrucomicrobia bacterium]|nr:GTP-binding protein [Verrucomicrobiota bacterium]